MTKPFPAILELGEDFYDSVQPAPFPLGKLRYKNPSALAEIGLENLEDKDLKHHFWKFAPFEGNLASPLALRYHGHQFRHYNPDLGDGRGFLFAQFVGKDQRLLDLGTKGSGTTPYSRKGDGRLTLKGALREALATELLESLGITTSKTVLFFETGEQLQRHDEPSPTRSAVLTRLSHSHIRFGTFQRLAYLHQDENIRRLLDYSLKNYFPQLNRDLQPEGPEKKAEGFFRCVLQASADQIANVMMCGFVHGVLNSDNMNITAELFDYGPYRFMPRYNPAFTAAYFDHSGLYAYGRQPSSFFWNLEQLQKSLNFAFPQASLRDILESFADQLHSRVLVHFQRRLNIQPPDAEDSQWTTALLALFFDFMQAEGALFEQTFFDLHSGIDSERLSGSPQAELYQRESFVPLKAHLKKAKVKDPSKKEHFYFLQQNPETLLRDEIEHIWSQIDSADDWTLFDQKIARLRKFRGFYSAAKTFP